MTPHAKTDVVMSGLDLDDAMDVSIEPPRGKSRAELEVESLGNPESTLTTTTGAEDELDGTRLQFSISDIMIIVTCGAIGLAGGHWLQPGAFAGLVGVVALFTIAVLSLVASESRLLRMIWWCMMAAYVMAAVSAVVRV